MKYGTIKFPDIANGEGIRVSLFVSGCRLNCPGCFNKEAQSFNYGQEFTEQTKETILNLLKPEHVTGLSLLGGDPMEKENQPTLLDLCKTVKEKYPNKDIWMWSGRVYPEDFQEGSDIYIPDVTSSLLKHIDVLIDGPFIQSEHQPGLLFRGSKNQRLIQLSKK